MEPVTQMSEVEAEQLVPESHGGVLMPGVRAMRSERWLQPKRRGCRPRKPLYCRISKFIRTAAWIFSMSSSDRSRMISRVRP